MRLPQPRSPAGAKSCTPGTWGYRAATTAAWASSTVLRWGNTRPYTPVSSACLITHWLRSRALGGIRTIGATSGCRLPFSAILLRFNSTCREVRRVAKLKPSCSYRDLHLASAEENGVLAARRMVPIAETAVGRTREGDT